MEWPPKSGKIQSFAEIDKVAWFSYDAAKKMINEKQAAFIEEAVRLRITN
jgi:predicted NUDIX family NTP pyrophosphohydrolase